MEIMKGGLLESITGARTLGCVSSLTCADPARGNRDTQNILTGIAAFDQAAGMECAELVAASKCWPMLCDIERGWSMVVIRD